MNNTITYKEWLEEWLESKKGFVKEATYANYSMVIINHIIPTLGRYKLNELTESKLQETVLYWLERGRIDNQGGLAEKTVKDMLMIAKLSIRAAKKKYKLQIETMDIQFPKSEKIEKLKILLPENQQKLIQAALLDLNYRNAGILLVLHTGLRIGELCALQWKDIDLGNKTLSVTKTIQRIFMKKNDGSGSTKIIISTPKTRSSIREIPLSSFIIPVLRKIQKNDPEAYLITGVAEYLEPRAFRSYYDRFLQKSEIPHINFHGIRHTFATRLIEAGADVKTVSELLGHATVNMTLNLYVHPQMEQKRKCVEMMLSLL